MHLIFILASLKFKSFMTNCDKSFLLHSFSKRAQKRTVEPFCYGSVHNYHIVIEDISLKIKKLKPSRLLNQFKFKHSL